MSVRIDRQSFFAGFALLGVAALMVPGCGADPQVDEENLTSTAQEARTSGALAKYVHTSSGAISLEADYSTWSAQWHTILQGATDNQLFFYNRSDGTAKIFDLADDGTLTLEKAQTLPTGVDIWVRGDFVGGSGKDLLSYNRATGTAIMYEILSSGDLILKFIQQLGTAWSLGLAGYWGNGRDDLVLYDKATGAANFYSSTGASLTLAHSTTWQKIWDHIVPGKFNSDGYTDLLYYNKDGKDVKVLTFNASYGATLTHTASDWPLTSHTVLVPGEFGGSSATDDILLYNPETGTGSFFYSTTAGALTAGPVNTGWQKKWTHITPVRQPTRSTTDLLFYSNAYDVPVVPVRLSNSDGSGTVGLTSAQFQRWLDVANETYQGAGIRFVWDGIMGSASSTALNAYACSNDPESLKDAADALAGGFGAPEKLVVFFRANGGGDGCGSPLRQYVMMPGYAATGTTYYRRDGSTTDSLGNVLSTPTQPPAGSSNNVKLLAHEVGHYFGLAHTYSDATPSSLADMDVDRTTGTSWTPVYDTPPSPSGNWWDANPSKNRCDDTVAGEISIVTSVPSVLTLNPERHNVMLNGVNCDLTYTLSPGQIDAVREALFSNRVGLTQ